MEAENQNLFPENQTSPLLAAAILTRLCHHYSEDPVNRAQNLRNCKVWGAAEGELTRHLAERRHPGFPEQFRTSDFFPPPAFSLHGIVLSFSSGDQMTNSLS